MIRLSLAAIAFFSGATALAQRDFSKVEIKTTQVADGIYMLEGWGGNIGLSEGVDGAFVIDDQFAPLNDKIRAAIAEITDAPVEFVLNTHYHGDHTGGNAAFASTGSTIIAHDNVRTRLAIADDADASGLPTITFSDTTTIYRNGQEIHIFHPKNAHTDGDAIAYFREANVVHMGDVMFSGLYPYIDVDAGGNINGFIAAQEAVDQMINDDTKLIPGHGPVSARAELHAQINMLKDVRNRVQALIDDGLDEDAVVAAAPLADLDEEWTWGFINGERMTRSAYRSLVSE